MFDDFSIDGLRNKSDFFTFVSAFIEMASDSQNNTEFENIQFLLICEPFCSLFESRMAKRKSATIPEDVRPTSSDSEANDEDDDAPMEVTSKITVIF